MAAQQINLYSPQVNAIKRWADSARVARVMKACGCTEQDAIEYLVAEEGDEADAVLSYRTDRMEVQQ